MTTKTCTKCKETKATTEFQKNKNHKDGLQYRCKSCQNAAVATYEEADPDRTKAQRKIGKKNFFGKMTVAEATAYKCVDNARFRSDLSSADLYGGRTFTEACAMTLPLIEERLRLEAETGVAHHIDHIIPIAAGGTHTADNLQVLTAAENFKKGATE